MFSSARDRDMQHSTAFAVRSRIRRPDEGRGVLRAVENNAIKLLSFAFVHVHDVDTMQNLVARERLFLCKRSV